MKRVFFGIVAFSVEGRMINEPIKETGFQYKNEQQIKSQITLNLSCWK